LRENLSYQSIRDPLTSLYNRRYLSEFLLKLIYQSERAHLHIAVLMLDFDHFKRINDVHGHEAGDLVLKEVGQLLGKKIRSGDMISRYGGEEFIIILYNADIESTMKRAEDIRKSIASLHIKFGAQEIGEITVSIGVAIYPQDGKTSMKLIEAADKALYVAKNRGRNKVVLFSDVQEK
jgi:diguanylate cyclase (GGDEF)-like protein